ncbi:MAG: c-type cytochrome domain-containing protein, partial [Verrucomicrobiota bacterium]
MNPSPFVEDSPAMDSRSFLFAALVAALVPAWPGGSSAHAEPGSPPPARSARLQFNRDIRPLLSDQCFACHGFDAKKRKAGLRLDTAEGAFAANREGRVAIKPGDPAGSELWRRLETTDPDAMMPPPEAHKSLSAAQKDLLRRWIEQGAPYQRHWAFEPTVRPAVPDPGPG